MYPSLVKKIRHAVLAAALMIDATVVVAEAKADILKQLFGKDLPPPRVWPGDGGLCDRDAGQGPGTARGRAEAGTFAEDRAHTHRRAAGLRNAVRHKPARSARCAARAADRR